jgi:ABC-type multidrug transport system fused ATPase/permease subunit
LDSEHSRRAALKHLAALLRLTPKPAWGTPVLISIGLATSLAETLGITLIVAFVFVALGQTGEATEAVGGLLGQALDRALAVFGSPTLMALGILLLILGRAIMSYANQALSATISERISEALRNRIHGLYLTAPYAFMQHHEQAQLMEVLGSESWLVADAYRSFTSILIGACSILIFGVFLLALSWQITFTACVGSLMMSMLLRRLSRPAQALGRTVKQVHQDLAEQMLMTIEGLRTIRAYGQERAHQERFLRSSSEARRTSLALTRLSALLDPITEVGFLLILFGIAAAAVHGGTSLATVLAAAALLYRLQPHAREIEGHLLYLAQIEPRLRSVRSMLKVEGKAAGSQGHLPMESLRHGIRFEGVSFRYADGLPLALDNVSFEIPAGRTTALVGASGAGKTTVIHLLLRLYVPAAGTIQVDRMPLQDLRRTEWLGQLAVAGQDVDLIEGTVIDNILMADAKASRDDVLDAARMAGVADFVDSLPEGYETWIGQQGHRFSGGQRQRLGLARALLRKPQLLILDEAMNALDNELEHRINQAIAERFHNCTVLIISHHSDTVRHADHLIHLHGGRVATSMST